MSIPKSNFKNLNLLFLYRIKFNKLKKLIKKP